ncbi:hypothetical protein [uncultured Jatrophihabitans sp.]|uniref:hypothetical protein n=1 Tax=uncultured Jatrophihabitans sp. TaxID=1610747 RepID=UPI0035C9AEC4
MGPTSLIAPSTSAVTASTWLEHTGVPIGTTGNRHSRFTARPRGTVIAWCLHLDEVLNIERTRDVDAIVLVRAFEQHAPWITAHEAEHLGGEFVPTVPEASPAIKAMVKGISLLPIVNQGLADSRERSMAVQALTYFHDHGHQLNPAQLVTEAIRNEWPRESPLELADLARQINAGKRLRFKRRLVPEVLTEWSNAASRPPQ